MTDNLKDSFDKPAGASLLAARFKTLWTLLPGKLAETEAQNPGPATLLALIPFDRTEVQEAADHVFETYRLLQSTGRNVNVYETSKSSVYGDFIALYFVTGEKDFLTQAQEAGRRPNDYMELQEQYIFAPERNRAANELYTDYSFFTMAVLICLADGNDLSAISSPLRSERRGKPHDYAHIQKGLALWEVDGTWQKPRVAVKTGEEVLRNFQDRFKNKK